MIHCECAQHEGRDGIGNRRMDPKQNQAALFEGLTALHCDLPEILIEGHQDSTLRFREFQKRGVLCAGIIGPRPDDIVTGVPQRFDGRQRKVLVREQAHQTGSGYALYS